MKVIGVFFKEAITWPGTKYSGNVSFDEGKPGLHSMEWKPTHQGVYVSVKVAVSKDFPKGIATTFVPVSNIKCINLEIDNVNEGQSSKSREVA